ncbi:MAG: tetratricopeptide repeat protein [Deltaproteobacteria bacterium]|nr:tetratricopeptide repeat protein [Deltaproteobacteria bacterium]
MKTLHRSTWWNSLTLAGFAAAAALAACSSPEVAPEKPEEKTEAKPEPAEEAKPVEEPKAATEAAKPADEPTAAAEPDKKPDEPKPGDAKPAEPAKDDKPALPPDIRYSTSPAESMIADGVKLLEDSNLVEAQQRLINATKQDPKSATAWYNLALCQYRLGSDEDALASAKQAIAVNNTFSKAVVLAAVVLERKGQAPAALAMVDEALKGRPSDVMLLGAKGRAQVASGDYTQGLDTCVAALRLDHSNPELMRYMAEAYLGLGRTGLAKLALERAMQVYLEDMPKSEGGGKIMRRYDVRISQGGGSWRGVKAEALVREAGLAQVHYLYGRLHMKEALDGSLESWEKARDKFKKAIEMRPDYAEAWNNLGLTLVVARNGDDAEAALSKALELQPQMIEARINLGSAIRVKRLPKIDESRFPDKASQTAEKGRLEIERAMKAREAFEAALKQDPRRPEPHFNLGILYLENKMSDLPSDEARFQKSLDYFAAYKEIKGSIDANDPIEKYIADAKLFLTQEQTKRINAEKNAKEKEEEARKKAEEDAKKKAEDEEKARQDEEKKKADEEAKRKAEEEKAKLDEEARKKAEEEKAKETPPTPPPTDGATPPPADKPPEPTPPPADKPAEPAPPPAEKPSEPAPPPPPPPEKPADPPPPPPPDGDAPPPPPPG